VSDLKNPFSVFENMPVTPDGYLQLIDPTLDLVEQIHAFLPWLDKNIHKRTMKIEVSCERHLLYCQYYHINYLYPLEYSKIALQISNNIYQNQYLLYKEGKIRKQLK